MSVLESLRAIGLPMASRWARSPFTDPETETTGTAQRFQSWTTDEAKAAEARELGALVIGYESTDERFSGWEVTCRVVEWDV